MPSEKEPKSDAPNPAEYELINKALNDIEQVLFKSGVKGVTATFAQSKESQINYKIAVSRADVSDEDLVMHLTNLCAFIMERRLGFDRSEVKAFLKEQFAKNLRRMKINEDQIAQMLSFLN